MDIAQQMQSMQNKIAKKTNISTHETDANISNTPSINISNFDFGDYSDVLSNISDILVENKDLVLFSYLLEIKEYVSIASQEKLKGLDEELIKESHYIDVSVMFCDDCNTTMLYENDRDTSCLEQCYSKELFTDDYVSYIKLSKESPIEDIKRACDNCLGCSIFRGKPIPFCPYKLCALIKIISTQTKKSPKTIYEQILGKDLTDFIPKYNRASIISTEELMTDINGINSKSARCSMLLEQMGLFNINSLSDSYVDFSYVELCNNQNKTAIINDIINFWNDRQGNVGRIIPELKEDVLNTKENCKRCSFEQCPHKVAAYLHYIAKKHSCNPYSLMCFVADENTISKLSPNENYQFDKYKSNINNIPITESSKKQYIEIIKYIVNHSKDSVVPIIPFNVVLHTSDEKIATEVFKDFSNAIWYFNYLSSKSHFESKTISIANTSFDSLIEQYEKSEKCMVVHIENIELLSNEDDSVYNTLMPKWIKVLEDKKNNIITFVSGDKYKLQSFFAKEPKLYNRIFSHHLFVGDMSEETVFKKICEKLSKKYDIDKEFEDVLWDCIADQYQNSELKSYDYIENLYETILFNHYSRDINTSKVLTVEDLPQVKKKRSENEIFKEINEMIGLQSIKDELKKINALAKYNQKNRRIGSSANYHMVFSGSAGTGKTTVAKLLSEILYIIGAIKQNKLIVCSGKDLIGEYMGQTSPKVAKMCERAYNGILFIDEAYQLNPYSTSNANSYKEEAIAELLVQMENNRDRLVVIFAGYTKEMNDFIERSNSGMKSRIGNIIEFPDYTKDELLEIFKLIAQKENLFITNDAIERVSSIIEREMNGVENFGNARFVRHLFERSMMKHAFRTCDLEENSIEIKTLDVCDIDDSVIG